VLDGIFDNIEFKNERLIIIIIILILIITKLSKIIVIIIIQMDMIIKIRQIKSK